MTLNNAFRVARESDGILYICDMDNARMIQQWHLSDGATVQIINAHE